MDVVDRIKDSGQLLLDISRRAEQFSGKSFLLHILEAMVTELGMVYGCIYEWSSPDISKLKRVAEYSADDITSIAELTLSEPIINLLVDHKKHCWSNGVKDIFIEDILLTLLQAESLIGVSIDGHDGKTAGLLLLIGDQYEQQITKYLEIVDIIAKRIGAELESSHLRYLIESREEENKYLAENSRDMIWEMDSEGIFTYVNSAANSIYGYEPEDMLNKHFSVFMSEADQIDFLTFIQQTVESKQVSQVLVEHRDKEGKPIRLICNAKAKFDESGNLEAITGISADITEFIRAQILIKNNNELFSGILSRLPVIFFRTNENGHIIDIRGNGLKRMGVKDMEWVGNSIYGLFVGMDDQIKSVLKGETVTFESKGTCQGKPWWFFTSMFFDCWTGFGAVGFAVDITDQKLVEDKLVNLLSENRILAQRLVEVQEEERSGLARELHDELGQSITAVKSLATAITTQAGAGNGYNEFRSLGNSIVDLSDRLYGVVSQIMKRLRPDILDSLGLMAAIRNCIVSSQLEKIGIKCKFKVEGNINDLDEVVRITVYRMIQECLTNISKYAMASNVNILIKRQITTVADRRVTQNSSSKSARELEQDQLTITVTDDGVGMDLDEDLKKTDFKNKMGLQGIKERMTALGGKLDIESLPGKGVRIIAVINLGTKINTSVENVETKSRISGATVNDSGYKQNKIIAGG